ncbi:MAG TPA: XRE family transcriptional regulator [Candidatus Krumholzibacteria bacterium]
MMDAKEAGRRIRRLRAEKNLTLKMVEAASGVSATHVSEIERGETIPTIGALSRIARALGKRTAFFLEENELADVSVLTAESRVRESTAGGSASLERLTASIPGGCIQATRVTLAPGRSHRSIRHGHDGVEAMVVLRGRVRVDVGDAAHELSIGDTIHFDATLPHAYTNASRDEEAVLVWIASRRDVD